MKNINGPVKKNTLLWWISIISIVASGLIYYLLGEGAQVDVHIQQQRTIFPILGIVVAGVCLIVGTAGRWFYPK